MKNWIQKVSFPDDWAENMLAELDKEKEQAKKDGENFVQNLRQQKTEIEQKMEKLLDLYIAGGALTLEEYQAKKQKLLNEKLEIEQKIRDFEQMGNNWLEPMKEMIFEAKQAKILLSQSDNYQIREFLKNVGSNFILKDKKFNFCFKIGWRALAEGEPTTRFSDWRYLLDKIRTFLNKIPMLNSDLCVAFGDAHPPPKTGRRAKIHFPRPPFLFARPLLPASRTSRS